MGKVGKTARTGWREVKFEKGDRVILTEIGRREFPRNPISGTVVSKSRKATSVHVLSDGQKCPVSWHIDYWVKLHEPTQAGE